MFKDYFSQDSAAYSRHRPGYPDSLFSYLSSITNDHNLAWDCATGSGQSAVQLAQHFNRVIATDASTSQIRHAVKHAAVQYCVSRAESSAIEANSLDLITVAQALHWFDLTAFTAEVDRTLKDKGIFAVWTYNLLRIRSDIDELINDLYSKTLEQYWSAERRMVEQGYQSIEFPDSEYTELSTPDFNMTAKWNVEQLIAYLSTWSAVKAYISKNKQNPIESIKGRLLNRWGNAEPQMTVTWPLTVRVWQKN